ncbi:hypothetical protein HanRHA438_Chr09g0421271 [Helianthus annuus]|nr:hypothetical protein HanRHA438_Chr09g0421271 [Helianthus annuus]
MVSTESRWGWCFNSPSHEFGLRFELFGSVTDTGLASQSIQFRDSVSRLRFHVRVLVRVTSRFSSGSGQRLGQIGSEPSPKSHLLCFRVTRVFHPPNLLHSSTLG